MALLDDVYKQIKVNNVSGTFLDGDDAQPKPPFRRIDPAAVSAEHDEEVGVASGYAIQNPAPSGFVSPPQNHANDIDYDNYQRFAVAGNKAGLLNRFPSLNTTIITLNSTISTQLQKKNHFQQLPI